ncbi:phosphoribosylaminoimidazolesuccinocarboxamide synthase [Coxiella-like endosymbiont]|uniref:phosphoribosylaminoimidazolesuccinocarboxamide synthase n=1 Tax=Coxiella-like endosymbiont TaxID=1592897 RepID=UPI003F6F2A92
MLFALFSNANLILVDAKYEFGVSDGEVYLGDEISPRFLPYLGRKNKKPLDKDRFCKDLGLDS